MPQHLLTLPTEVLDSIYAYLDWSRSTDLVPYRKDILNVSLVCRHVRETVLPRLFRVVTLCLRWNDGALLEPALYRMKLERPELAQHVRCVYIVTKVGHRPGTRQSGKVLSFNAPERLEDWLSVESIHGPDKAFLAELSKSHRLRVNEALDTLSDAVIQPPETPPDVEIGTQFSPSSSQEPELKQEQEQSFEPLPATHTAEDRIVTLLNHCRHRLRRFQHPHRRPQSLLSGESPGDSHFGFGRALDNHDFIDRDPRSIPRPHWRALRLKLRIDAFAVLMLCLSATTTEIIFDSGGGQLERKPWQVLGQSLVEAACQVFQPRLESFTMIQSLSNVNWRNLSRHQPRTYLPEITPSFSAIGELKRLNHLILANSSDGLSASAAYPPDRLETWQLARPVHETVKYLEFWNIVVPDGSFQILVDFAKNFHQLQRLAFNNVSFSSQGMPSRIYPPTQGRPNLVLEAPWLYLMVELRRSLPPDTCITNANIRYRSFQLTSPVPESALRWILKEAIPPGAEVDHQRAERLFEDFESFLLLWAAEDSERGRIAREERKEGDLVDVAMCNRWKQFENVRRARRG